MKNERFSFLFFEDILMIEVLKLIDILRKYFIFILCVCLLAMVTTMIALYLRYTFHRDVATFVNSMILAGVMEM